MNPAISAQADTEVSYLEAIRLALGDALRADDRVFLLGEDIGHYGGAFGATSGLWAEFGDMRVIDTPIAEEGFVGAAIGAAWMGQRPVVELQFADFVSCAFDMLVTVAAKTHWRSRIRLPLVVRAPAGGGVRGGPFHASSPEGWFVGTAGLKVVCPGTVTDAYGLLRQAIEDDDPVLFFEHKLLYRRLKEPCPDPATRVAIGQARIAKYGSDATIVTYGAGVQWALEAAASVNADVEVLDLRTLWPLDERLLLESVARTSRVLLLQEASRSTGVASLVLATISSQAFECLDAPPRVHAPPDTPVPFAPALEDAYLPNTESTIRELEHLLAY